MKLLIVGIALPLIIGVIVMIMWLPVEEFFALLERFLDKLKSK